MHARAIFPQAPARAGMYESFFLRAVAPDRPLGVWIRHTVHKRPGRAARGSVWCTVFDAQRGAPFMHKLTSDRLLAPAGAWIEIGEPEDRATEGGARLDGGAASGRCGAASWSLRWSAGDRELRHLPRGWLYRSPLPRTKLTSPAPQASFSGTLEVDGTASLELDRWSGMVGHNWGAEHAERWIWLHGVGFQDAQRAWLDVAIGRILVAGRMTPWVANGAVCIDGRRYRLGGLGRRGSRVEEAPTHCAVRLPGEHGVTVEARVQAPPGTMAGWRYSDPDGGEHDVLNCSVAELAVDVQLPGELRARTLRSAYGGAYELGLREHDHGIAIAPFEDG